MIKHVLNAPETYVSPECEKVELISNGILCVSENFNIDDLPGNDWGDFSNGGSF